MANNGNGLYQVNNGGGNVGAALLPGAGAPLEPWKIAVLRVVMFCLSCFIAVSGIMLVVVFGAALHDERGSVTDIVVDFFRQALSFTGLAVARIILLKTVDNSLRMHRDGDIGRLPVFVPLWWTLALIAFSSSDVFADVISLRAADPGLWFVVALISLVIDALIIASLTLILILGRCFNVLQTRMG